MSLEERIEERKVVFERQIIGIKVIIDRLDDVIKNISEKGITSLETIDIQLLRRYNIQINDDTTIY